VLYPLSYGRNLSASTLAYQGLAGFSGICLPKKAGRCHEQDNQQ
jgi:hypothetical protein